MSPATVEIIAQQIDQLDPEEKWTVLSLLIERLRRQAETSTRQLCDYYGLGKGRGFRTAQEVDAFIEGERTSWER